MNASGGTVLVGIADDGNREGAFILSKNHTPVAGNEIKTKTEFAIVLTVEIENLGGKSVAYFKVPNT